MISRNGGKIFLRGGHQYCIHSQRKNGTYILRCSKYRRERCPGLITTEEDLKTVLKSNSHICRPDYVANEIALKIDHCKKEITETNKPVSAIYSNAQDDVGNGIMPSFRSVKNALYRARKKEKRN